MGVDRKPPLPPPTEPSTLSSMTAGTEVATDLSRRSERTSYSIPDDGSPITIPISGRTKRQDRPKDTSSSVTQTSLLIEYFEGSKGASNVHSRPSVRVKVTPSAARKIRDADDHIQITETGRSRQPSYTKRISLGSPRGKGDRLITEGDDKSVSSYASATEESNLTRPPVEIEVMHKDHASSGSVLSSPRDTRIIQQTGSDVSTIPPSSFLDGHGASATSQRTRSRSLTREATEKPGELKAPARRRSRSLSRERILLGAIEKIEKKGRRKSRSRSVSGENAEGVKTPRRKSSRSQREDDVVSAADSSSLTTSALSPRRQSGDQYSIRSGTSNRSINNPHLLHTVEDAIRRLILPELIALKKEQKTQANLQKFERGNRDSLASGSSMAPEEGRRRISKMASAPDVGAKPTIALSRDGVDPVQILSGNSIKSKKERRRDRGSVDSVSEKSYERASEGTVTEDKVHKKRSRDRHGLKELAAVGTAGALTAAALNHHNSKSSLEQRERRKRRSKSRSRSASINESVDSPRQLEMLRMPLEGSDLQPSEITRASILTERTDRPRTATSKGRDTPTREPISPASRTPTRTPQRQRGLLTHHSNLSRGDLSIQSVHSDRSLRSTDYDSKAVGDGLVGVNAGAILDSATTGHGHDKYAYATNGAGDRGASPVQSIGGDSSLSLDNISHRKGSEISIKSMTSAPSTKLAQSKRPQGANPEKRDTIVSQDVLPESELMYDSHEQGDGDVGQWFKENLEGGEKASIDEGSARGSPSHYHRMTNMTNYTDDSMDGAYLDKVAAGQRVVGIGANPEYRSTPEAVRSYVASLHEPSAVDVHSTRSGRGNDSYAGSENAYPMGRDAESEKDVHAEDVYEGTRAAFPDGVRSPSQKGSGSYKRAVDSPRQSVSEEEEVQMGATCVPDANDPMPAIGHFDDESEISTNPSIIRGPIGGVDQSGRQYWPYQPTPPQSNGNLLAGQTRDGHNGLSAAEVGLADAAVEPAVGVAATRHDTDDHDDYNLEREHPGDYSQEERPDFGLGHNPNTYQSGNIVPAPVPKDEGYISAANPRSPGMGSPSALTPEPRRTGLQFLENDGLAGLIDLVAGEDPFYTGKSHHRNASGNSHGMPSPLYDSATGRGIDRIQSKDIVALMDHLTVRDAQRNARDTEILVTLVRSAAEMRNSFEDMKRLLADQEKNILDGTEKSNERSVQRMVQGPRPQPLGTPRFPRRASTEEDHEDMPTKRRNVFRRALKGLGMKNSNDLAKIEDMLVRLLLEVEGLKATQELQTTGTRSQPMSMHSYDNLQNTQQGYEPEGQAGTSSTNPSGYFSNPPSRQPSGMRGFDGRRASDHRISTVPEGDEELSAHDQAVPDNQYNHNELTTPSQQVRGGSVPLDTPPQVQVPAAAHSNENTPKTERHKKHKSSSSSFLPKISRWSESTTASITKGFRGSSRKEKEYSEAASRSGSEIDAWAVYGHDPQGADRLRSAQSLEKDSPGQENQRPPSPLIPTPEPPPSIGDYPEQEDPKFQAHRNSINLQHPQPRPGPSQRYQHHLESQAQNFDTPRSLASGSDHFGSATDLDRYANRNSNRHSGGASNLSPNSDGGRSHGSITEINAPPRPPKIPDEPLIPQRPTKTKSRGNKPQHASPLSSGQLAPDSNQWSTETADARSGYDQGNGSPHSARSPSSGVPQRKPTGPRPPPSTSGVGVHNSGTVVRRYGRHRDTFGNNNNHNVDEMEEEDVTF
ncbi:hypothetical protein GP486_004963 [Trichoglossum hirsutum]|uniref:Uncharacterized protein n=1 Tax=Trichoglossum hirsutum TaxID=265104 RepID=A0A9P8RNP6_9PEZI|nr:hypothetical protein GP486_004963 [Trichoglossum hirsutum]